MNVRLGNVSLLLKEDMEYEAIMSQLQSFTKKVLCVEDGVYLRIFEESGPFPLGVVFFHKQRRWGMTEYFFRYAMGTEDETVLCVFGRDNAETFCPDFIDEQDTSEEEDLHFSSPSVLEEEIFSDIFTSSSNTDEEDNPIETPKIKDEEKAKVKDQDNISTQEQEQHIVSPPIHIVSIDSHQEDADLQENIYNLSL